MRYPKLIDFLATEPDGDLLAQHLVLENSEVSTPCAAAIITFDREASVVPIGSFGLCQRALELMASIKMWEAAPWTDAMRDNEAIHVGSPQEVASRYPRICGIPSLERSSISRPLSHGLQRIGAVHLLYIGDFDGSADEDDQISEELLSLYVQLQIPAQPNGQTERPNANSAAGEGNGSWSARQRRVLKLLADGQTNAQIGRELGFSESTVKQETMRIYRRLEVADRRSAVDAAVRQGVLEPGDRNGAESA